MPALTLLGPQRLRPTLAAAFDELGITGRVAAVTAGWQEREAEVEEMTEHLGRPVGDLRLHRRSEQVFAEDPVLFRAHRARQDLLRKMQQLYRYRLDFTIQPARELLQREDDPEVVAPATEAAIEALRRLDAEHLEQIAEVYRRFAAENPAERSPALMAQRRELAELLADCEALALAGGHVAALVNRLRLFGIAALATELPIVAWSAGAMVLGERIVLFHDSPPQGAGNAEVLDHGLALFRDLLPLPHAGRRLRLDDPHRVELFARRFAPALCVPLDPGDSISRVSSGWRPGVPARHLALDGKIERLEAA